MQDNIREFGMDLGHKALARDWAGVHGLLAPWLRQSVDVDAVRRFFEDEYRLTLKDSGIEAMHFPEYPDPELGGNAHTNATSLRAPMSFKPGYIRPVAPDVTDANFRYWLMMRLQCSDEQWRSWTSTTSRKSGWPSSRPATACVSATGARAHIDPAAAARNGGRRSADSRGLRTDAAGSRGGVGHLGIVRRIALLGRRHECHNRRAAFARLPRERKHLFACGLVRPIVTLADRSGNRCHPYDIGCRARHFDLPTRIDLMRLRGDRAGQGGKYCDSDALRFHLLVSSSVKAKEPANSSRQSRAGFQFSCPLPSAKAKELHATQEILRRRWKREWLQWRCGIAGDPGRLGGCTVSPARP